MATQTPLSEQLATRQAAQQAGVAIQVDARGKPANVEAWLKHPGTPHQLSAALPNNADAKRWLRIILSECSKNPKLLEADPQSFALAVLTVAQLGLEPGPLGHSYLTGPFRNNQTGKSEVVPILGYKGLIDLAYRGRTVDLIDAVPVRAGEPFRIVRGTDQRLEHEELASCKNNEVIAYYAIAFPAGGGRPVFEIMWPDEVEAIRKRSKAKDKGPWATDYEAMALKSPVRRMLNRGKVKLTPEARDAIALDEARELGYERPDLLDPATLTVPEGEVADQAPKAAEGTTAAARAIPERTTDNDGEEEPPPPDSLV